MGRSPVGMVFGGLALLAVMALVLFGPSLMVKVLPASTIAWFESLGEGLSSMRLSSGRAGKIRDGADPKDPNSYLLDTSDGWEASDHVATLPGGSLAFVADVIANYSYPSSGAVPGAAEPISELSGCSFTPPSPEALVGHAGSAKRTRIGLATYGDSHIADAVQKLVDVYRTRGIAQKSSLGELSYETFDVAVTETAKPVYLVLEAQHGRPVFNIHLAPGARIERVVLIGGEEIGVANLAAEVPVEAISGVAASACGMAPFYRLNPGALYFQSVASGAIDAKKAAEYEARFAASEAAWEDFFRASFGVGAAESLSGDVGGVTLAVVGPVPASPEAKAVWTSIKGAPLRVTVDQYLEAAGQADGNDFDSVVKAVARSFAWGDLKNLSLGAQF